MYHEAPTWFFILGPISLLLLLGIVAAFVALLWNPKTRPFGLVFLGVLGIFALVMMGTLVTRTVHVVPGAETESPYPAVRNYEDPSVSHNLDRVPQIELEQAAIDMHVIAPVAEVVERLSEASDEESRDTESIGDAKANPPELAAKERSELPDWITALPSTVGGVSRQVISSGPRVDVAECSRAIDLTARAAVQQFLAQVAQEERIAPQMYKPELLGISTNWIRENLFCSTPKPCVQNTDSSVGPMKTLYVQLELDPNDKEYLRQRFFDYVREDRLAVATVGGVFVLGGIGLLFGLLKFDTWTKGYYTKRLFLGVPAAIIGVGTLLALFIA